MFHIFHLISYENIPILNLGKYSSHRDRERERKADLSSFWHGCNEKLQKCAYKASHIHLPTCNNVRTDKLTFIKFDIESFTNISWNIPILVLSQTITDTQHADLNMYLHIHEVQLTDIMFTEQFKQKLI
jgi:hypothetical protein